MTRKSETADGGAPQKRFPFEAAASPEGRALPSASLLNEQTKNKEAVRRDPKGKGLVGRAVRPLYEIGGEVHNRCASTGGARAPLGARRESVDQSTGRTDSITTGLTGTSPMPVAKSVFVATLLIFSTTSVPLVTRPKTV